MPYTCRGCRRIGSPLCDRCKNNIILEHRNCCPNCKTPNTNGRCRKCHFLPPIYAIADRTSLIGSLVHDFKYASRLGLRWSLAEISNAILPEVLGKVIIIPLPTISRHVRERGFDHTFELAKCLAKLRPGWRQQRILVRANDTVQVGAPESVRLTQAKHAFKINPKYQLDKDTTYILIDDVWTTGASMKAAHKLLTKNGAKKTIMLILAVSQLNS